MWVLFPEYFRICENIRERWRPFTYVFTVGACVVYPNETKDPKDVILSVMPVRLGPKDLSYLGDVCRS
jgi:hypothetical protein